MGTPAPVRTAIVALALLATLAWSRGVARVNAVDLPNLAAIPLAFDGWAGVTAPPLDPAVARVLAADQYVHRYYRGGGAETIEMDIAYYGQPRVGSNMHSPLNCLPGNGWELTEVRDRTLDTAAGRFQVRDTIVERRTSRFALTYWFQSRNRIVANEFSTRFYLVADALRRKPTDAGLVRLLTPADADASAERTALAAFATRLIPEISARLR